jgi:hypothetical protein
MLKRAFLSLNLLLIRVTRIDGGIGTAERICLCASIDLGLLAFGMPVSVMTLLTDVTSMS